MVLTNVLYVKILMEQRQGHIDDQQITSCDDILNFEYNTEENLNEDKINPEYEGDIANQNNEDFDSVNDEPRLKYSRVPKCAQEIIARDCISCIAIHSKFIVIGTEWGNIYVLDHQGNPSFKTRINAHSTVINQISIDSTGEYIASCSDDSKVMIFGLLDDKQYPVVSFKQPIKAVAIAPDFKRSSQFVTGDTRLLLISKGLFSSHNHKVLQDNRTLIRNIKWNNHIIVYATDDSVFIFDMKEQKLIGIIEPDKSHLVLDLMGDYSLKYFFSSSNKEEFYCRISWISNNKFMIGWGHLVQICIIKNNPNYSMSLKQLEFTGVMGLSSNPKKVESLHSFMLPDLILGIVPYDKYVLGVVHSIDSNATPSDVSDANNPNYQSLIMILEPHAKSPDGYKELSYERINLNGYRASKFYNIHLEKIPFENEFYIVSSKDLILAKEREINDRIEWLIEKQRFERALALLKSTEPDKTKYKHKDIGIKYIDYLISKKEFIKAAELCQSINDDKESWERIVLKFLEYSQIEALLSFIPIDGNIVLSTDTYMRVLEYQFVHNISSFLNLLKTWPSKLYNTNSVINFVLKSRETALLSIKYNDRAAISRKGKEYSILQCLGILYERNREYEKSLECYFRMKDEEHVYELMSKRKMFDYIKEKLLFLFSYNKDKTLTMLMENMNDIPPESIVKILSPTPIWLFHYLHVLFSYNMLASEPYHMQMVNLYAEFKSDGLLSFLKSSDKYDLNAALELCNKKGFHRGVIYLLGRVGKSKEALERIMSQENSVYEAIDYCQENADEDLWKQLLTRSKGKPDYIKAILENSGMDIDVKTFIQTILSGSEIPKLKDSLVILFINNEKRDNLINAHQTGKWNDIFKMINSRFISATKPVVCNLTNQCIICSKLLVNYTNEFASFPCSHFFHKCCMKETEKPLLICPVCNDS